MGKHACVGDRSGGRGGNPDPTDFDRTASLAGEYSPDPLYVYCTKMLFAADSKMFATSPGYHIYVRGPHTDAFAESVRIYKRESLPWWGK